MELKSRGNSKRLRTTVLSWHTLLIPNNFSKCSQKETNKIPFFLNYPPNAFSKLIAGHPKLACYKVNITAQNCFQRREAMNHKFCVVRLIRPTRVMKTSRQWTWGEHGGKNKSSFSASTRAGHPTPNTLRLHSPCPIRRGWCCYRVLWQTSHVPISGGGKLMHPMHYGTESCTVTTLFWVIFIPWRFQAT